MNKKNVNKEKVVNSINDINPFLSIGSPYSKALSAPIIEQVPKAKADLSLYNQVLSDSTALSKPFLYKAAWFHGSIASVKYSFPSTFWITAVHTGWEQVDVATGCKITIINEAGSDVIEIWAARTGNDSTGGTFTGNDHIYFNPPLKIDFQPGNKLCLRPTGAITYGGAVLECYIYGFTY